jgi:ubiquinone/menaquinone biosynthesis C-methylase UbiE
MSEQTTADAAGRDRQQREAWRRGAEGWERRQASMREKTAPVSEWLVDALELKPGERLLELAAGPGETGFLATARLGESGRLLSTDQSPEMIEVAKRRAAELGLDNVEFAVLDAQELDLEPASFDAALCRWGFMLMGRPDEAWRRTRRVLRDGGRLALATWDTPDKNMWMVTPMIQLVSRNIVPMPNPSEPGPFALANPDDLQRRLLEAGFYTARAEKLGFTQRYPSFEEYWAEMVDLGAPIAAALSGVDQATVDSVREGAREALSEFIRDGGSLEVPASAVVTVADA